MKSTDAAKWGDLGAPQREKTLIGKQAIDWTLLRDIPGKERRVTSPREGDLKPISEVLFRPAREKEVS